MTELDDRTKANLDVVLEEVCRPLPHGGDHELRKAIAEKLLASAIEGNRTIGGLTEIARVGLAQLTKKSA
ncbi:hypothetical protein ABIF79_010051 [Bradyrhizobium japonicum]